MTTAMKYEGHVTSSIRKKSKKQARLYETMHNSMDYALSFILTQEESEALSSHPVDWTQIPPLEETWAGLCDAVQRVRASTIRSKTTTRNVRSRGRPSIQEKTDVSEGNHKTNGNINEKKGTDPSIITSRAIVNAKPTVLDLSGKRSNLSGTEPSLPTPKEQDIVTRLRALPLVDSLEIKTPKFEFLMKWLENEKGENDDMLKPLQQLIVKLKRAGALQTARPPEEPSTSPSQSTETLNDRLYKEDNSRGKGRKRSSTVKSEGETKKLSTTSRKRQRSSSTKRNREFVVESDEELEEEEQEEEEYSYGSDRSDDLEEEVEIESDLDWKEDEKRKKSAYLTYATTGNGINEQVGKRKTKVTNGTSAFNAIELVDSESEEVGVSEDEMVVVNTKANPKPKMPVKVASKKIVSKSVSRKKQESESEPEVQLDKEASESDSAPEFFDMNENDVYIVEALLDRKVGRSIQNGRGQRVMEPDLYLVKWAGYEELTWEPDGNIPRRLIDYYRERELAKRDCEYQIDKFFERKVLKNTTSGKQDVVYLIQWWKQTTPSWEARSNLPEKIVIWLEKASRSTMGRAGAPISGPSSRKKGKREG